MFDFIKNYFNPKYKKVYINSYKYWLYLGIFIQFIYSMYVFVVKHGFYTHIYVSTILITFTFSLVEILIIWLINSLIARIIYKIIIRNEKLKFRKFLIDYLPYCITQNLYFIVITLVLSMFAIKSNFLIRTVETVLSVYTFVLFYKRHW